MSAKPTIGSAFDPEGMVTKLGGKTGLKELEARTLFVRDLMTEDVYSVGPEDDLSTVYDLMDSQNIRHVPVLDKEGELVGLLSRSDLLSSGLFASDTLTVGSLRDLLRQRKVKEIMIHEPTTVEPDMNIIEAAEILLENKFGCLPVAEGDTLAGILTESDFVKYVRDHCGPDDRSLH